jgi:hypothetical protein
MNNYSPHLVDNAEVFKVRESERASKSGERREKIETLPQFSLTCWLLWCALLLSLIAEGSCNYKDVPAFRMRQKGWKLKWKTWKFLSLTRSGNAEINVNDFFSSLLLLLSIPCGGFL